MPMAESFLIHHQRRRKKLSKQEGKAGEKILDEIFKKLDLKSLIDTAIFTALTEEAKEELVKGIMSYLSSQSNSYGRKTILQEAFESSLSIPLRERMQKIISEDEQIMAEIERCVKEATQKFIQMDKEQLINNLTSTMHKAFERDY